MINNGVHTIKTGAEIPFTRCFYEYKQPTSIDELESQFNNLEKSVRDRIFKLFGGK